MSSVNAPLSPYLRERIAAHAAAGRTALRGPAGTVDYEQLGSLVDQFASGFSELRLARGCIVGLVTTKTPECVAALLAAMQVGLVPAIMEPRITAREMVDRANSVDMAVLVFEGEGPQAEAEDSLANFNGLVRTLGALRKYSSTTPVVDLRSDDSALLLFTSGSTGRPKGVLLSQANLRAHTTGIIAHTGITTNDRLLHIMPLHHTNGINNQIIAPLLAGAEVVLIPRFRATEFVKQLREYMPTYVTGVPTIFSRVLEQVDPKERFQSLRFLRCGSAPITTKLHRRIEEVFNVPLVVSYGLSEATCTTTMNPPGARQIGSIGTVISNQCLKLFEPETHNQVALGDEGEICITGPALMKGYIGTDTASPIMDGWLRTGDLGRVDAAGYVTITGRLKDVIIRGGENISPALIENRIMAYASVFECCVVGVPDSDLGEVPVAFIVARRDKAIVNQEIMNLIDATLSAAYRPRQIFHVNSLPVNKIGKIDRIALTKMVPVRDSPRDKQLSDMAET